jgi:hypothetical protein
MSTTMLITYHDDDATAMSTTMLITNHDDYAADTTTSTTMLITNQDDAAATSTTMLITNQDDAADNDDVLQCQMQYKQFHDVLRHQITSSKSSLRPKISEFLCDCSIWAKCHI